MLRQPGERMKRFTIDVPESLHRRIKAECALRGVKMADYLRQTLEKLFPPSDNRKIVIANNRKSG